jgi:hypothetical protein
LNLFYIFIEIKLDQEPDLQILEEGSEIKIESIRIITVKNLENKFAPLYFQRITFKLQKETKSFNFSIYFSLINVMYTKKLYYPCITLISMLLEEIHSIRKNLYETAKESQKAQCFIMLYEFLLFIQVYILILQKNYERALYELRRIKDPICMMNKLLHKILLGLCYNQCLYFEYGIYTFLEASFSIKDFIESYDALESDEDDANKDEPGKKERHFRKTAPEGN